MTGFRHGCLIAGAACVLAGSPTPLAARADGVEQPETPQNLNESPPARRMLLADDGAIPGVQVTWRSGGHQETRAGARAFAAGSDVAFGAGEYRPHTPDGLRLVAHEAAHTLQPGAGEMLRALSPIAQKPEADHDRRQYVF